MTGAESLRRELAASIDRTLVSEARRNESTIAVVRGFSLLGMLGVEAWLLLGGSMLGDVALPAAGLSVAMLLWSIGVGVYLRRGRFSSWVPWVVPLVDAAYFGIRQSIALSAVGVEHFVAVQDLSSVVAFAGVLIVTGAFRLSGRSVVYTAALGGALYLGFALAIELHPFFMCVHLLLLGATTAGAAGLTAIVQRAVHGEVTRLTLSRLLPAPVLAAADADPLALLSEPRSVEATVMVTDLRGFTQWAEHQAPLDVLAFLNTVQGKLADIVLRHGGTVDKFMGDGMLAVFGAPEPLVDHASQAVSAAREMLVAMDRVGEIRIGIGIQSGEVVVGCLGSGVRMEFTVLGDTVNIASRLESATKEHGVSSLIGAPTAEQLPGAALTRVGEVPIRGREQLLEVFTLEMPTPDHSR